MESYDAAQIAEAEVERLTKAYEDIVEHYATEDDNYHHYLVERKELEEKLSILAQKIRDIEHNRFKQRADIERAKREKEGADKMELENFTLGSLRRAVFDGDTKTGSLMAGQVAGQVKEIRTLEEIFADMFAGAKKTYDMLGTEQF